MPPDSTYQHQPAPKDIVFRQAGEPGVPLAKDSPYTVRVPAKAFHSVKAQITPEEQFVHRMGNWFFGLVILTLVVVLIFPRLFKRLRLLLSSFRVKAVIEDRQPYYHALLLQYLPYYRSLAPEQQQRFLERTVMFMTSKQFEYVEIVPEERMPLLISATAVQLTFGLDHYLMEYFEKIYVLHHDYHYGLNSVPFQGHVAHDGIYLSWSNFLKGYDNYHDGDNVGLHEMAHALAYVNFNVSEGRDDGFHDRFIRFSSLGREIFEKMQNDDSSSFLGHYAASRYEEFWAVSVENFFERPTSFKIQLPELYDAMCQLLNQDTLKTGIVLNPLEQA